MKAIRLKNGIPDGACGDIFYKAAPVLELRRGEKQTVCQIVAEDDGGALLWDSGKVESDSMRANWGGEAVPPKTAVPWRLRLWDENGISGDWSGSSFEAGIDRWRAGWITGNCRADPMRRYPVDCFRRIFSAVGVKKARLYITACGLCEARLGGERAGEFCLAPGRTDYRRRVQYQTYDVTVLIRDGASTLTVRPMDGIAEAAAHGDLKISTARRRSCRHSLSRYMTTAACSSSAPTRAGTGATTGRSALPVIRTERRWTQTGLPHMWERRSWQAAR